MHPNFQDNLPFETEQRERSVRISPCLLGQQLTRDSLPENGHFTPIQAKHHQRDSGRDSISAHSDNEADYTRISVPVASARTARKGLLQVFSPDNPIRNGWDILYDVLILYSLCTSTFYLAYELPGTGMFAFDIVVWVFFVLDVFVTFNTAYYDEESHLVTSRRLIAQRYLTTWFLIDVAALLPFSFSGDYPKAEYYLRMLRFLRISDSVNFVDGTGIGALFSVVFDQLPELKIGNFTVSYYYASLVFQQICRLILMSYFIGCIFYWYAELTGPEKVYNDVWFDDSAKLEDEESGIKLLKSWYFILTTLMTIGYGDLLPLNFCERIFIIVILVLGIANFSMIMGSFVSLISEINEMNSSGDTLNQVSIWMDSIEGAGHRISASLKSRVLACYQAFAHLDRLGSLRCSWWQAETLEDLTTSGDDQFNNLPEHLQSEILKYLFSDLFHNYKSFFELSKCNFAYSISLHFQPRTFTSGELVVEEGAEVTEVLLLTKGKIAGEITVGAEHHQFIFFEKRLILGDYNVFTATHSQFTFRAVGGRHTQMLALPAKPLSQIIESFNTPTDTGYNHKKEVFKKSALFVNMLRSALQDFTQKKGIKVPTQRRSSMLMGARFVTNLILKDPAVVYEGVVTPRQKSKQAEYYLAAKTAMQQFEERLKTRKPLRSRFAKTPELSEAPSNTDQSISG